MLLRSAAGLVAALALTAPALATDEVTGNPDTVCMITLAKASNMAQAEIKDPATSASRKDDAQKWLDLIQASESWFIGRFTALDPAEREPGKVKAVIDTIDAMGEEEFLRLAADCLEQVEIGRNRVLRKMN